MKPLKTYLGLLILISTLIVSCGPRKIGYGVVLWEDESSALSANDLLTVYINSNIRDTYTFTKYKEKEMQELVRWRIQFFDDKNEALDFQNEYDEYKTIFGKTMENGLPVREEPNALSDRVYRLRLGEIVKVIGRQEEESEVGQYTGYWYHVLTKEGVSGYCFDVYLNVYDAETYVEEEESILTPNLIAFFDNRYVPDYYRNMIANQAIDLERFKLNYGLFPNLDEKRIHIILPDYQKEYQFTDIISPSVNKFIFEGTDLEIQFIRSTYISVKYNNNGQEELKDFVVINDIETIIEEEQKRREEAYEELLSVSNTFMSTAYGTLRLNEDKTFEWSGYDRLVPSIIPRGAVQIGRVLFTHFISQELRADYEGVISLQFNTGGSGRTVHFLYKRQGDGIQLTTLNGVEPRNKIFDRQSSDPVIIFFSGISEDT